MKYGLPKISVIIPVYNAEKHLRCCIDSILSQTFTDFELLLIDDGSTDKSGEICDEYARKDKRVKASHKENGGVSSARNLGLDKARGEWICFCDSDDGLLPGAFEAICENEEKGNILLFGYTIERNKNKRENILLCSDKEVIGNEEYIKKILTYKINTSPWGRAFKSKYLNNIRFNTELKVGEDLLFNLEYLSNLGNNAIVYFVPQLVYTYRLLNDSAMHTVGLKKSEYEKLSYIVIPYVKQLYGNRFDKELASFKVVNIMQPLWMSRTMPDKKDDDDILSNYPIGKEYLGSFFTRYIRILSVNRFFGHMYLFCYYIKMNVRKLPINKFDV